MERSNYDFFGPSIFFPISEPEADVNFAYERDEEREAHTTQFDTQDPLQLGEDLSVRNSFSGLVILDDGRLLVGLLSEFLLRQLFFHTSTLNSLLTHE